MGQSEMTIQSLATFSTQDTGRRQAQHSTEI